MRGRDDASWSESDGENQEQRSQRQFATGQVTCGSSVSGVDDPGIFNTGTHTSMTAAVGRTQASGNVTFSRFTRVRYNGSSAQISDGGSPTGAGAAILLIALLEVSVEREMWSRSQVEAAGRGMCLPRFGPS